MPEPTLALTFQDLQIRVAEFLGVASYGSDGTGAAAVPTGTADLELVKRLVNDGYRRFLTSKRNWNWITPVIQITFDPDGTSNNTVDDSTSSSSIPRAARYYMPPGFYGDMISNFTYSPAGPRVRIENCDEGKIRALHTSTNAATGDPFLCALRRLPDVGNLINAEGRMWELVVYPTPGTAYTVTGKIRIFPNKLVNDNERHAAGFVFDEAIVNACLAEAERQRHDMMGERWEIWLESLQRALAIDSQTAPRKLGYNSDRSDGRSMAGHAWYTGVDTYESGSAGTVSF